MKKVNTVYVVGVEPISTNYTQILYIFEDVEEAYDYREYLIDTYGYNSHNISEVYKHHQDISFDLESDFLQGSICGHSPEAYDFTYFYCSREEYIGLYFYDNKEEYLDDFYYNIRNIYKCAYDVKCEDLRVDDYDEYEKHYGKITTDEREVMLFRNVVVNPFLPGKEIEMKMNELEDLAYSDEIDTKECIQAILETQILILKKLQNL